MPCARGASCRGHLPAAGAAGHAPVRGRFYRAHAGNGRPAQLPEGRGHHSRHSAGGPFRRAQHAQPARYRDRGGGRPAGRHAADRAHAASVQQGRLAVVLYPAAALRHHRQRPRAPAPDRSRRAAGSRGHRVLAHRAAAARGAFHAARRAGPGPGRRGGRLCGRDARHQGPQGPDRRDRSADGQPSQAAPVFVGAVRRYSSRPRNTWRNWACRTAST